MSDYIHIYHQRNLSPSAPCYIEYVEQETKERPALHQKNGGVGGFSSSLLDILLLKTTGNIDLFSQAA